MPSVSTRIPKSLSPWLGVLLTAAVYFLAARLSLLLAVPPVEASPVWPPAGIAVAATVILGYRGAVGVYLGALSLYLLSWLQGVYGTPSADNLVLVSLLAVGPVVQAMAVVYLMRAFSRVDLPEATEAEVLRFLFFCAPVGAVIAPTYAHTVFYLFGLSPIDEDTLFSWVSWWIGDAIGMMTITPLALVLFLRTDGVREVRRKFSVALPMAFVLFIVIVLFFYAQHTDKLESNSQFQAQAERLHNVLSSNVQQSADAVYALKTFIESSEDVQQHEFERFSGVLIRNKPYVRALEWIPKISNDEREAFEARLDTPSRITAVHQKGLRVAEEKAYYFPVLFVNPLKSNESALGFDVSSSPIAFMAQMEAVKFGDARATQPIELVQGGDGFVIYAPVLKEGVLFGLVAMVIQYESFFDYLLTASGRSEEDLSVLVDIETSNGFKTVYQSSYLGQRTHQLDRTNMRRSEMPLFGQTWVLTYESPSAYQQQRFVTSSVLVLLAGMFFTALFGGWMLTLTGQALRVSREVDRRTLELQQEVAEREQTQQELSKLSLAIEHSPSMVLITDPAGGIEYANPKYTDTTGYLLSELSGMNADTLYAREYGEGYYTGLVEEIQRSGEWKGELKSYKKNGQAYWAQVSIAPVYDDRLMMSHVVSVHQDITESKQIQDKLSYQATHDQLTGLINRYEFERQLQRLLDMYKLTGQPSAFCFCDLDQFKVINDTSGHAAGDALLKQVSQLLQQNLRRNDVLARLGGDEFGVLMEHCSVEEAMQVAKKILTELEEFRFVWSGALHTVGTSIGVVMVDEHNHSVVEIFKNADSACYAAKEAGRNRIHLYTADDEVLAKREGEISWVGEIASALEEDRFEIHGQIIRPIKDKALKPSVEILIRLRSEGQLVMPGAFLPAAERYGLSSKIDRWVVGKTFEWLADHPDSAQLIESLAINLSGHSLGDNKLLDYIIAELAGASFDPSLIKFEITETAAIANLTETSKFIARVKEFGCELSLDDFGSGLSSFAYLKNLAVDYLKIDGMFVKDIAEDPIDLAMVKSINEIGQVMNKRTIAEFVENDEILAILADIGVDYAQGYGIGRPCSLEMLLSSLRSETAVN